MSEKCNEQRRAEWSALMADPPPRVLYAQVTLSDGHVDVSQGHIEYGWTSPPVVSKAEEDKLILMSIIRQLQRSLGQT